MAYSQKEIETIKSELQKLFDKKFKGTKYLAVIALVSTENINEKLGHITVQNQYIRVANVNAESPYYQIKQLIQGVQVALESLFK